MLFPLSRVISTICFFVIYFFFGLMLFYSGEAHRFAWFGRWLRETGWYTGDIRL